MKKDLSGDTPQQEDGARALKGAPYERHVDDISEEELAEFGLGRD